MSQTKLIAVDVRPAQLFRRHFRMRDSGIFVPDWCLGVTRDARSLAVDFDTDGIQTGVGQLHAVTLNPN